MNDFALWRLGALAGSLVPGVLIAYILLRMGRGRFSPRLLAVAAASGAMISVLPLALSLLDPAVGRIPDVLLSNLVLAFGRTGLSEEAAKLIACWFIVRTHFARRTNADFILGCAAVALGFALIENVSYVFRVSEEWKAIAIGRAIFAVPIHAFIGLGFGRRLVSAEARPSGTARTGLVVRAWLIAAALHGFYDLPTFLAQMLPLSPTKVVQLATFLSVTTPTLITAVFFGATAAICRDALLSASACRSEALAPPRGKSARWLFSDGVALFISALLLLAGAASSIIGATSLAAGALPSVVLVSASAAAILGTGGWMLLRGSGVDFASMANAALLGATALARRKVLAATAAAGGGAAALVAAWGAYVGVRHAVAIALVSSGLLLSSFGERDEAVNKYTVALDYEPGLLEALAARAEAYRSALDYDRALADADLAVRLHPQDALAHALRGAMYGHKHDHLRAIAEFGAAIALDDGNAAVRAGRAAERVEVGDLDGALADANRALELQPKLSPARMIRADVFLRRNDRARAMAEVDAALQLDPKNSSAYFYRGRLRFEDRDYAGAAVDFRNSMAVGDGQRSYVALWLFAALGRQGQDGRRELAFWRGLAPRDAWPFPLIELFLGDKQFKEVLDAATTPDRRCEMDFYVGELLVLAKRFDAAATAFRRAEAGCPADFIEKDAARKELVPLAPQIEALKQRAPPPPPPAAPADPPQWRFVAPGATSAKDGASEALKQSASPASPPQPPGATSAKYDAIEALKQGALPRWSPPPPAAPVDRPQWRLVAPGAANAKDGAIEIVGALSSEKRMLVLSLRPAEEANPNHNYLATVTLGAALGRNLYFLSAAALQYSGPDNTAPQRVELSPLLTGLVYQKTLSQSALESIVSARRLEVVFLKAGRSSALSGDSVVFLLDEEEARVAAQNALKSWTAKQNASAGTEDDRSAERKRRLQSACLSQIAEAIRPNTRDAGSLGSGKAKLTLRIHKGGAVTIDGARGSTPAHIALARQFVESLRGPRFCQEATITQSFNFR